MCILLAMQNFAHVPVFLKVIIVLGTLNEKISIPL